MFYLSKTYKLTPLSQNLLIFKHFYLKIEDSFPALVWHAFSRKWGFLKEQWTLGHIRR